VDPRIVRYSERPELWDGLGELFDGVWPEYNLHGDELNYYWRQLYDVFPEWQFMLVDPEDQAILAEGHTVPVAWDGTDEDLGPGIDATIAGAFRLRAAGGRPAAVSAMAAEVAPRHQGRGLAPVMLEAMAALTREAGLAHLIAPVRPSRKDRYPTIPIERYARWARDDGAPFDPWIRVHARMGARTGRLGVLDEDAVPRDRRLRVPGGPGHRPHRPGERHRRLLGTQPVDDSSDQPPGRALDHSRNPVRPT
jgi:GNAT superfamily N-acetyltransferase